MLVQKNLSPKKLISISGWYSLAILAWIVIVFLLYYYEKLSWLTLPWLPLSLIGTAVAFYLGFKNNSSYDRMWEARKIWGSVVNSSREWGISIKSFINSESAKEEFTEQQLLEIKKKLIYRHIAWLYTLRDQLLVPLPWEHFRQKGLEGIVARNIRKRFRLNEVNEDIYIEDLKNFFQEGEYEKLHKVKNRATQIIDMQSADLSKLQKSNLISDYKHVYLQQILRDFYIHQGMLERIKKFPLPRQYGSVGLYIVMIFTFLLPFGMISEFAQQGNSTVLWLSLPFTFIVSWVFLIMELVGDYSENPFERFPNDIPMLSICRTIEIDLMEMLGEKDLPPQIESEDGVLM